MSQTNPRMRGIQRALEIPWQFVRLMDGMDLQMSCGSNRVATVGHLRLSYIWTHNLLGKHRFGTPRSRMFGAGEMASECRRFRVSFYRELAYCSCRSIAASYYIFSSTVRVSYTYFELTASVVDEFWTITATS